ncbi:MAG: 3,4-dihydroxy-2-butanone-4-phosphate synthase [bacterium]|nr:3,4-dihydroxy-2-butanone-4-phosphate synthase [bacterium]
MPHVRERTSTDAGSEPASPFCTVEEALAELRAGRMVVLTDDENRENEGDLVLPAEFASAEHVTFMLSKALGYLCLSLTEADCDRLNLHPQSGVNTSQRGTAFTVSIDLSPRFGGTTGVSAKERAKCIRMAIDPKFGPDDFVRPGHINPLRARDGGVLVRTGQTEGSVDLCRMAGLYPAACIIEVMKPDGEMARVPDLQAFCAEHRLKMCSVAQLIAYRLERESLVRRLPPFEGEMISTRAGSFRAFLFESVVDALPHLVLTVGDIGTPQAAAGLPTDRSADTAEPVLVRMHRRNTMGDVFGELDAGDRTTGDHLQAAMERLQQEGRGAIVYLRTAGDESATDLESKLQKIRLGAARDQSTPRHLGGSSGNEVPPDLRQLGVGAQILRNLGITKLRLMTRSAKGLPGLDAYGLEIVETIVT